MEKHWFLGSPVGLHLNNAAWRYSEWVTFCEVLVLPTTWVGTIASFAQVEVHAPLCYHVITGWVYIYILLISEAVCQKVT